MNVFVVEAIENDWETLPSIECIHSTLESAIEWVCRNWYVLEYHENFDTDDVWFSCYPSSPEHVHVDGDHHYTIYEDDGEPYRYYFDNTYSLSIKKHEVL